METFGLWSLLTDVIILFFYAIVEVSEKTAIGIGDWGKQAFCQGLKSWCQKCAIGPAPMNNYLEGNI